MGTYEELKAAIQQVIQTNGNNEITGATLQNALLSIVNVVGANATFAGIATPNTNPGTADQNVFYLATEAGTYINFGGIIINKGEAVILSNKTGNWVKTVSGFATQQQLTELSEKIDEFDKFKNQHLIYRTNRKIVKYQVESILNGYVTRTGVLIDSASYKYTEKIPVKEGDIMTFKSKATDSKNTNIRFLCAYDENDNAIETLGKENITSYTVPNGVAKIVLSFLSSYTVENPTCYLERDVVEVKISDVELLKEYMNGIPVGTHQLTEYTYPSVIFNDGYWVGGKNENASYFYIKLDGLNSGDRVQLENPYDGSLSARFADFYLGDTRVASAHQQNVKVVTIPDGVDTIYLSYGVQYKQNSPKIVVIKNVESKRIIGLQKSVNKTQKKDVITTRKDELLAEEVLLLTSSLNKKNSSISFSCRFNTFDTIEIAHGVSSYGNRAVVGNEKVTIYIGSTLLAEYAHDLNIDGYLNVSIIRRGVDAYIILNTKIGTYKSPQFIWSACYGNIQAKPSMQIHDVLLTLTLSDIRKDIYLFGDSYTSIGDPARYPYYLNNTYGCMDNMMMLGKGGIGSGESIWEFRRIISLARPKFIIWALGMNDADSNTSVNAKWKMWFDEVCAMCDYYEVELVLATIPNVPTINNSFKNSIVRESGRRYIDFAAAVNAENVGSSWYEGMLSSDGVHPTELGAKALASRFVVDMPEIMDL